jgi:hypothetical protein
LRHDAIQGALDPTEEIILQLLMPDPSDFQPRPLEGATQAGETEVVEVARNVEVEPVPAEESRLESSLPGTATRRVPPGARIRVRSVS